MRPPIQDKFFLESILHLILSEMKNLDYFLSPKCGNKIRNVSRSLS